MKQKERSNVCSSLLCTVRHYPFCVFVSFVWLFSPFFVSLPCSPHHEQQPRVLLFLLFFLFLLLFVFAGPVDPAAPERPCPANRAREPGPGVPAALVLWCP